MSRIRECSPSAPMTRSNRSREPSVSSTSTPSGSWLSPTTVVPVRTGVPSSRKASARISCSVTRDMATEGGASGSLTLNCGNVPTGSPCELNSSIAACGLARGDAPLVEPQCLQCPQRRALQEQPDSRRAPVLLDLHDLRGDACARERDRGGHAGGAATDDEDTTHVGHDVTGSGVPR